VYAEFYRAVARIMPMIPATTSNTPPANPSGVEASPSSLQLKALLNSTGIARLDHTGWIRVSGEDRVRWLNGMATNAVQQLTPGTGSYNFFLNAQGRIQADGYVFASVDALFIETARRQVGTLVPYLDHYIIMDDVELADVTESRHGITIIGPQSVALLGQLGLSVDDLDILQTRSLKLGSADITLIHAHSPLVPRYELWTDEANTTAQLLKVLEDIGAIPCDTATMESLRILEGTPLYGADIRDRDLPQETNQTRALHFSKGCYLGQEIVERIRSRGSVHRTFTAFLLHDVLPAPGTPLEALGKQVGELTSVASIPIANASIKLALGYVRREALDRVEPLQYEGGTATPVVTPYSAAGAQLQPSDSLAS
jgi:folate-binding protein YgfZ